MTYGKITSTGGIQLMPNPVHIAIANPTEAQKAAVAGLDNWLECVYTTQPEYDPDTQYLTESWELQNGKAVQVWTINTKPQPEPDDPIDDSDALNIITGTGGDE